MIIPEGQSERGENGNHIPQLDGVLYPIHLRKEGKYVFSVMAKSQAEAQAKVCEKMNLPKKEVMVGSYELGWLVNSLPVFEFYLKGNLKTAGQLGDFIIRETLSC